MTILRKLLFTAAAVCLPIATPVMAQGADLAEFLAGRWGDADENWKDAEAGWIHIPCEKGHPRADAAYTFSGPLDALMVRTSDPDSDSYTAVDSPVLIGGQLDPAAIKENGVWADSATGKALDSAAIVVAVSFRKSGMFVAEEEFTGLIALVDNDRIFVAGWDESAKAFSSFPSNLVRCGER
jgi:hypothetical protein